MPAIESEARTDEGAFTAKEACIEVGERDRLLEPDRRRSFPRSAFLETGMAGWTILVLALAIWLCAVFITFRLAGTMLPAA